MTIKIEIYFFKAFKIQNQIQHIGYDLEYRIYVSKQY